MDLEWQVCSRARLSRDARFDGKFFVGVLTTGIYCRPICRAPNAMEKNVRYFPSAAAAAEAGLRPCLRCRPECAPGTPAWSGTRSTVSRALKLISETGLEEGGVEALAEHLGVGSRHLRRLFLQHLGAAPRAVAETRRLHFAKKLIDETRLPMGEVAMAAGFGCVRRFNAGIRKAYKRTPTQIRRLARQKTLQPENQYLLRLRFRAPYNWKSLLSYLTARIVPGVEAAGEDFYRRSICVNGGAGYFEVTPDPLNDALALRVQIGEPRSLFFITERIRAMFDLNADWSMIAKVLKTDPMLVRALVANPGLRVPGCWSGFELTVRAILAQQVSAPAAVALASTLVRLAGTQAAVAEGLTHIFPGAEALADADLAAGGLPPARAHTIRALARAVCEGRLRFEGVVDSAAFLARLKEIPGIGDWTLQYVAMRALGEPDAFPSSDFGLLQILELASSRDLERRAESWRPWRAYAAICLWDLAARGKPITVRNVA
jgi:AraC family transcriptional regulator, regulatory protein of adaptative response / DNA-3-methyladenine glycosylase II